MDALEKILAPFARLANRQISMTTPARELARELDGSVIAVRIRDTALAMYFHVADEQITLSSDYDGVPDAAISGSLLTLAQLAGRAGEDAVREGKLELAGDAALAESFRKLLWYARPDLEEELSGVIGDAAAHGLGDLARSIGDWGLKTRSVLRQNLSEYLQEEAGAVPSRREAERFRGDVEAVRDDVARLEARLKRLEQNAGSNRDGSPD